MIVFLSSYIVVIGREESQLLVKTRYARTAALYEVPDEAITVLPAFNSRPERKFEQLRLSSPAEAEKAVTGLIVSLRRHSGTL